MVPGVNRKPCFESFLTPEDGSAQSDALRGSSFSSSSSIIEVPSSVRKTPSPSLPSLPPRRSKTTTVAVRIRPLRLNVAKEQQQPCIRPVVELPQTNTSMTKSPNRKVPLKKQVLSPCRRNLHNRISSSSSRPESTEQEKKQSVGSTSLIAGTENQIQFHFDHVIGPSMTQEQCYQRVVGDVVEKNIMAGANTSILVLGPKRTGKNFTLNGGWNVRRKAGERTTSRDVSLAEDAGILPRAVKDLFYACQQHESLIPGRNVTVCMSLCAVASHGGKPRDLLFQFRKKGKKGVIQSLTRVQVQSTEEVRRLLSRVTDRRISDIENGRTLHTFMTFDILIRDGASIEQFSSRLTILKLATSMKFKQEYISTCNSSSRTGEHNLKEIIHEILEHSRAPENTSSNDDDGAGMALNRQLDKALSGTFTYTHTCDRMIFDEQPHLLPLISSFVTVSH
jgi:Kinesin motor domain